MADAIFHQMFCQKNYSVVLYNVCCGCCQKSQLVLCLTYLSKEKMLESEGKMLLFLPKKLFVFSLHCTAELIFVCVFLCSILFFFKGKGKGQRRLHESDSWPAALYNLGSGSWLAFFVFMLLCSVFRCSIGNYGRPLSVSGRPCYILPMFFYLFFLWPPYSPALVNGGSRKFYTWWTLSVIREVTTWIFSWSSLNYRVGQKVTKFAYFETPPANFLLSHQNAAEYCNSEKKTC